MSTSNPDRIAYLQHSALGTSFSAIVAIREKDIRLADKVPTVEAALETLSKHAPPSKVPTLYIHFGCAKYSARVDILKAVEAAGYKPHVLSFSFDVAVYLSQTGIKANPGDIILVMGAIGFHPSLGWTYMVCKKVDDHFEMLGSNTEDIASLFSMNFKHVIVDSSVTGMDGEVAALRHRFKKNFRVLTIVDHPLSMYLWDMIDNGSIKGYKVPEMCGMGLRFHWHKDNKKEFYMTAMLRPAKQSVKIDLADSGQLWISGTWLKCQFDLVKTYVFKEPANRIVEVTVTFGEDYFPKFDITVVEKTAITNVPVFFEIYHSTTEGFNGFYISDKRLYPVAYHVKSACEVFEAMTKHAGTTKSIGIDICYDQFYPFDVHKEIIAALPTPRPKVCCSPTQYYLTMILKLSEIKCYIDEYVALAIRRHDGSYYEFGVLQKTANGFKGIGTGYSFPRSFNFQKVVIAVTKGISNCCWNNVASTFPGKELIISDWSKLPDDTRADFSRHQLLGTDFDGYMVEQHLGMKFVFEAGDKSVEIDKVFETAFDNHVEKLALGNGKCTARLKFTLYGNPLEHFVKEVAIPAGNEARCAVLTLSVDEYLIPTAEIKVEMTSIPIPNDFIAKALQDGTLQFFLTSSDSPVVFAPCCTDEQEFSMFMYYPNVTAPINGNFPNRASLYARIAKDSKNLNVLGVVDHYPDKFTVSERLHRRQLLNQANLPNVITVNGCCLLYSLELARANANKHVAVGETAIVMSDDIAILKRTPTGYKLLDVSKRDVLELCNEYGTNFIVLFTLGEHHIPTSEIVRRLKQRVAPRKFVFSDPTHDTNFLPTYYHSFFNGGDFDGLRVADYLNIEFTITFGNEKRAFKTGYVSWPHNLSVEIDIGEAMSVDVAAMSVADFMSIKPEVVKTFKMKTKERRLVALTMQILHPYDLTAKMDVLRRGDAPRIVMIQRHLDGFCQSVLTGNSSKVESEVFPTAEAAIKSCTSPHGCPLVIDVALATVEERVKLFDLAKQHGYGASLGMHSICLDINKLLVSCDGFECAVGDSVFLTDLSQPSGRSFAIQRDDAGYRLVRASKNFEKLRGALPAIRRAFIVKDADTIVPAAYDGLNVVILMPTSSATTSLYQFLASSIASNASFSRPHIANFAGIVFTVKWGKKTQNVEIGFASVPYSDIFVFHVETAENLKINMTSLSSSKSELIKQFNFKTPANRVLIVKLAVDRYLKPSATLIRADRVPTVGLKFTSDNQVLIHAGADYTGDDSIPAYLSFTNEFKVGVSAQENLKTCPKAVVYDIVRLLANNFDPSIGKDPSWKFRVWREGETGIMVDLVKTRALVTTLFAIIVKCTLTYINQHCNGAIEEVGIQLPSGSVISEDMRCEISEKLGVNLIIYYY
uniref:RNA helicase n=1 Tax=Panagrellus redivivus TaxID=6233 RepID=A0A7E4ZYM0_PANRE